MVRQLLAAFILWTLFALPAKAQKAKPESQLPDETKPSSILTVYAPPLSAKNVHCAESVDLSDYMPPVQDQGVQNSCSAWAVGYACRSYYNNNGTPGYFNKLPLELNKQIISPTFIYNSLNHGRWDSTVLVSNALKLMVNTGSCSYASMPYTVGCNVKPNQQQKQEAQNYKIETFGRLSKASIVDEIIAQLKNNQPVVIGAVYGGKYFVKTAPMPDTVKYIWRTLDSVKGGHAVVIVGFDEQIRAFKLMNSFGSKWGNNGYGWLSYDIAPQAINSAYVIKPEKNLKPLNATPQSTKVTEKKKEKVARAQQKLEGLYQKKVALEQTASPKQLPQPIPLASDSTPSVQGTVSDPELSWWQKTMKNLENLINSRKEKKINTQIDKVEKKITQNTDTLDAGEKRTNKFSVTLTKVEQPDSTQFALDLTLDLTDCACDSYQVAVPFFWGDVPDRNKKGPPVLSYKPEYSLANGQAAIILDKRAFTGKAAFTTRISIPLNQIAIPSGTQSFRGYIKALNRLITEAVWYNDGFSVKSFSTIPVDVYY